MSTVTDLTVAEVLARMEAVLAERGWCQKDFVNDTGCVCLEGAARCVITGEPDMPVGFMLERQAALLHEIESVITQAIGGCDSVPDWHGTPGHFGAITSWNDEPGRTVDDVRRMLTVARMLADGTS